ncbi:MAG: ABC transporter substrate-binding protein [Alphaproteobacteria bacterium]
MPYPVSFHHLFSTLVLFVGLSVGITACGESAEDENTSKTSLTRVTFATDWVAQAEHGGFYMAKALGLYEDRGMTVDILPGGGSVNVPQLVAAGAVDFAMGSNSFIPFNLIRAGVPARAVMASFQKDPQVLITHPREDVNTLGDIQGKPVMIADASRTAWWPWLAAEYGFTDSQIRKYTSNVAPFLVDTRAIQQGYITSEPYIIARELGVEPEVYLLADYGYPSYATLVLVRQEMIDERAPVVRAFVEASIEGWRRYLLEDPAPAHALILKDNPDMEPDILKQARQKLLSYGIVIPETGSGLDVGAMTRERWETFFTVMRDAGLYDDDLPWQDAFTMAFLPASDDGEARP